MKKPKRKVHKCTKCGDFVSHGKSREDGNGGRECKKHPDCVCCICKDEVSKKKTFLILKADGKRGRACRTHPLPKEIIITQT